MAFGLKALGRGLRGEGRRPKAGSAGLLPPLRALAIELLAYAALLAAYLLVVLRALAPLLLKEAERRHVVYAVACLLLMLGQGLALEFLTSWLVRLFVRSGEKP